MIIWPFEVIIDGLEKSFKMFAEHFCKYLTAVMYVMATITIDFE